MNEALAASYDAEYLNGHYSGEPTDFVDTIIEELRANPPQGYGLYVGCGSGRNFIPLLEAGLELQGLDISSVAIDKLRDKIRARGLGHLADTRVGDFEDYDAIEGLNYIISLHAFQHGDREASHRLFEHTHQALQPGGRLFLQVNSVHAPISYSRQREGTEQDGYTIKYLEGPKKDQLKHFYSASELGSVALEYGFDVIRAPIETPGKTGTPMAYWKQWETVWQKASE